MRRSREVKSSRDTDEVDRVKSTQPVEASGQSGVDTAKPLAYHSLPSSLVSDVPSQSTSRLLSIELQTLSEMAKSMIIFHLRNVVVFEIVHKLIQIQNEKTQGSGNAVVDDLNFYEDTPLRELKISKTITVNSNILSGSNHCLKFAPARDIKKFILKKH